MRPAAEDGLESSAPLPLVLLMLIAAAGISAGPTSRRCRRPRAGRAVDAAADEPAAVPGLGDDHALRAGARRSAGLRVPDDSDRGRERLGGQGAGSHHARLGPPGRRRREASARDRLERPGLPAGRLGGPADLDADVRALERHAGTADGAAKGRPVQQMGFHAIRDQQRGVRRSRSRRCTRSRSACSCGSAGPTSPRRSGRRAPGFRRARSRPARGRSST